MRSASVRVVISASVAGPEVTDEVVGLEDGVLGFVVGTNCTLGGEEPPERFGRSGKFCLFPEGVGDRGGTGGGVGD